MPPVPVDPQSPAPSVNVLRALVEELVRRRRSLIFFPIGIAVLSGALTLVVESRYEAVAVFAPAQSGSQSLPASLQSIASQFGFALPSSGYSVYYYSQVLQSRGVMEQVANDTLRADGQTVAVLDLLNVNGRTPARRLEAGLKALDDRLDVSTDDQANLVTVRVEAPSPALAEALGRSFLKTLDSVISASERTAGTYERMFQQKQADSARAELHSAEDELKSFYEQNRSIESSPTLQVQEARLRRQIQVLQDIYLALVNQVESAKLEEARNTPAIALIEPPLSNAKKVWPKTSVWGLFGLISALMVSTGWLYIGRPALEGSPVLQQSTLVRRLRLF